MKFSYFIILISSLLMAEPDSSSAQPALPVINKLWNFNDPATTRAKFLELVPKAESSGDKSYYLELLTQIARTYSLQENFTEAHKLLDTVERQLTSDLALVKVRYLLERGRTFNSANDQAKALPLFTEAVEIGKNIHKMGYAIDAVHMVAIAKSDPKEQVEWNLKGIEMANEDTMQKAWLHALYNNIGESYLRLKDYASAYHYFHLLAELQLEQYGKADIYTIKDEAKALTLSGKPAEALMLMEEVSKKLESDKEQNGWIENELAEALYALDRKAEALPHFQKAYQLLLKDDYCVKFEPERLEHLKKMSDQ
ncbi:MAG TPA: tetratricopeptide repeat protein [Candidatus Kapabacteria bacterium]|nr:tetratricopeptide repeat protein [Candidatus Kapabacteria bacterium]